MNSTEAHRILRRMAVIWPKQDLPDATMERWIATLEESSPETAVRAVELLARGVDWWPTFAEWERTVRQVGENRRYRQPAKALPERVPPVEVQRARLEEARAALRGAP